MWEVNLRKDPKEQTLSASEHNKKVGVKKRLIVRDSSQATTKQWYLSIFFLNELYIIRICYIIINKNDDVF